MGLMPEDFDEDPAEVWPENWPSWRLWTEVCNQWRTSMGGIFALDYSVLFARMERMRLDDMEWERLFHDIRVIEGAALAAMKA